MKGFALELGGIKKIDFHEEFLQKVNEFSESWREAVEAMEKRC
jgi:hypothetical protein